MPHNREETHIPSHRSPLRFGPWYSGKLRLLVALLSIVPLGAAMSLERASITATELPGSLVMASSAPSAEATAAKPPPARLKDGRPRRRPDGSIVLVQQSPAEIRVCPASAAGNDCRYNELSEAISAARPGDTIVMAPGIYRHGATVDVDDLTIRGEPGAHLQGGAVRGKAALVITGARVTVDGLECSGVAVRDRNGACIRIEGDDLTVRNVNFHDNEQGILSGPGGGTVLVEHSRFERNGRDGRAHGLYIGKSVDTFVFRHNQVLSTKGEGHGVKSRAKRTIIEGNVIANLESQDSRAIDVPNGGEVVIRDNVLEKGPKSANSQMIGLALESGLHPANSAVIEGNLIIFDVDLPWIGQVLDDLFGMAAPRGRVILSRSPGPVTLKDNVIVGAKEIGIDGAAEQNRLFHNRKDAKLPPFPELPPAPPKIVGGIVR